MLALIALLAAVGYVALFPPFRSSITMAESIKVGNRLTEVESLLGAPFQTCPTVHERTDIWVMDDGYIYTVSIAKSNSEWVVETVDLLSVPNWKMAWNKLQFKVGLSWYIPDT